MKIFKIVLIILVSIVCAWLGYFYYQNRRTPTLEEMQTTATQLPSFLLSKLPVSTSALPKLGETNQQALTDAINQGKERVDMVLGDAIEVASDSSKPAAQKALDYGRYLYCKQVVDEYELTQTKP